MLSAYLFCECASHSIINSLLSPSPSCYLMCFATYCKSLYVCLPLNLLLLQLVLTHLSICLSLLSPSLFNCSAETDEVYIVYICNFWVSFFSFPEYITVRLPVRVRVGVQLSHAALGNVMSPLCAEEGNRDSWLELQTLALPRAHRRTDWWTDTSLTSSGNGKTLDAPLWIT